MKKFKKVVPALCALLVSAVMLGSSTYAWFSMNTKVTATGMSVTATSTSHFLVISNSETLDVAPSVNLTAHAGGVNNDTKVYPCAKATKDIKVGATTINSGEWYYAVSKNNSDAGAVDGEQVSDNALTIKKIDDGELTKYQLTYTFYIGLATGSADYTGELTIKADDTANATTGFDKGLSAIVKVADQNEFVLNSTTQEKKLNTITLTTTATKVEVVVYIDGNNTNVTSANITNLKGELKLAFSIAE